MKMNLSFFSSLNSCENEVVYPISPEVCPNFPKNIHFHFVENFIKNIQYSITLTS